MNINFEINNKHNKKNMNLDFSALKQAAEQLANTENQDDSAQIIETEDNNTEIVNQSSDESQENSDEQASSNATTDKNETTNNSNQIHSDKIIPDELSFNLKDTKPLEEIEKLKIQIDQYKQIIENDPIISEYLKAKQDGKTIQDVASKFATPDYNSLLSNDPKKIHADYFKSEFPDATQEDLDEAWDEFLNGRETPSISQKSELKRMAQDLQAKVGAPIATSTQSLSPELQAKVNAHIELFNNFGKDLVGKTIGKAGESSYSITAEDIESANSGIMSYLSGSKTFFDYETNMPTTNLKAIFIKAALFDSALPHLMKASKDAGVAEVIDAAANVQKAKNGSSSALPDEIREKDPDKLATKKAAERLSSWGAVPKGN